MGLKFLNQSFQRLFQMEWNGILNQEMMTGSYWSLIRGTIKVMGLFLLVAPQAQDDEEWAKTETLKMLHSMLFGTWNSFGFSRVWNGISNSFSSLRCLLLKTQPQIKKPLRQAERLSINMAATYSPALWCSTIGHEGLNFSVRYGKRWTPSEKPP